MTSRILFQALKTSPFLTFLMFLCSHFSQAQAPGIQRPQLSWDFFKNEKPNGAGPDASVNCNVVYRCRIVGRSGENVKLEFQVKAVLDTASSYMDQSMKKKSANLLKHEQIHIDICYIYAAKLLSEFKKGVYTINGYKQALEKMHHNCIIEVDRENKRYDLETKHGTDRDTQEIWDRKIQHLVEKTLKE